MVKSHIYSPASSERCTCCGASLLDHGAWYRDDQRVCQTCWEWGEVMGPSRKRGSWWPLIMTVGCVAFWVAVAWVLMS